MNLTAVVAIRFSILLIILVVCALPVFYPVNSAVTLLSACFLGVLYFISGWYETRLKTARIRGAYYITTYLPFIVISKRILRVFFFLVLAVFLFAPEVEAYWLVPVPLIIAVGELLFFLAAVSRKSFGVLFYPDYLFFLQDKERKVFPAEIRHIEYRYENFYLVLYSGDTVMINPDFIPAKNRIEFRKEFLRWAETNKVSFTEEAAQKISAEDIFRDSL